jgi:NAD(P)-dependent dehydrogenase (short-subunit alcohol dehydrogenase family)
MRPLADQTILITGATDGHGRALAAELAAAGATVLVHGRNDARGQEKIEDLRARTGNHKLHWLRARTSPRSMRSGRSPPRSWLTTSGSTCSSTTPASGRPARVTPVAR